MHKLFRRSGSPHRQSPRRRLWQHDCGQNYGWAIKICRQSNKCRLAAYQEAQCEKTLTKNHFIAVFKMPQNLQHSRQKKKYRNTMEKQVRQFGCSLCHGNCPGNCASSEPGSFFSLRKQIWSNKKLKLKVPLQLPTFPVTENSNGDGDGDGDTVFTRNRS